MPRLMTVVVTVVVLLGGCSTSDDVGMREGIGALTGALGGAFLGEKVGKGRGQVVATAAGTLAGLAVGADIGRSLDRANAAHAARTVTSHSQQAPVPGFAPPPRADGAWYANRTTDGSAVGAMIRDAQNCRSLDQDGLRPAFACHNSMGQWFILQ